MIVKTDQIKKVVTTDIVMTELLASVERLRSVKPRESLDCGVPGSLEPLRSEESFWLMGPLEYEESFGSKNPLDSKESIRT